MTDISNAAYIIQVSVCEAAGLIQHAVTAPHILMRPRIFPDGDMWCALLGDDLQIGISGFGKTPREACADFDDSWRNGRTPAAVVVPAAAHDLLSALMECEAYFDQRADADCDQDGFIPNEEMKLLAEVRNAIAKANDGAA